MRTFFLFIFIALAAIPSVSFGGYFQSTTTWIGRCEQPIPDADKQTAEFVEVAANLSPCYAYLMAIADALDASLLEAQKAVKTDRISYWQVGVCIPRSADQEDLRQAFLEYAAKYPYPQLTGTNPAYVVADSFAVKWPCEE